MPRFVKDNFSPSIRKADSTIHFANRWDHFLARFGIRRNKHRVEPGVYALGKPDGDSPVFVTANYSLSFDALRAALKGISGYILVLDTRGINVWCAAGKGTFSTDELVRKIEQTSLDNIVRHRKLILPQLGATGVSAHEVKKRSGFLVEYGPVKAADLPSYLENRQATPDMRRIKFTLKDRFILIPVEVVGILLPALVASVVAYFLGGLFASIGVIGAVLAGTVAFPLLLPFLPTDNFSTKGFILGWIFIFPLSLIVFLESSTLELWQRFLGLISYNLVFPPITAFLTLNFTGSTTYTSKSGVKKEIYTFIPVMAWMFGSGILLATGLILINLL
ncbi:MAG: carbon monoxide dehydrogenase [bacterium]|nr:MAG: carbon monoxide dehydrogenase [bacterium]